MIKLSKAQNLINKMSNDGPTEERVTMRFGNPSSRKAVLRLLKTIQTLSMQGSSRRIEHDVDGDGAYSFRIKGNLLDDVECPSDGEMEKDKIWVPGVD